MTTLSFDVNNNNLPDDNYSLAINLLNKCIG